MIALNLESGLFFDGSSFSAKNHTDAATLPKGTEENDFAYSWPGIQVKLFNRCYFKTFAGETVYAPQGSLGTYYTVGACSRMHR